MSSITTLAVMKPQQKHKLAEPKQQHDHYIKLKNTYKCYVTDAAKTVSVLSLLSGDPNIVVSICLGTVCSQAYTSEFVAYVDDIENRKLPVHIMVPVCMVLIEAIVNHKTSLDLDYLQTFAGFFSYRFAILKMLFDDCRGSVE